MAPQFPRVPLRLPLRATSHCVSRNGHRPTIAVRACQVLEERTRGSCCGSLGPTRRVQRPDPSADQDKVSRPPDRSLGLTQRDAVKRCWRRRAASRRGGEPGARSVPGAAFPRRKAGSRTRPRRRDSGALWPAGRLVELAALHQPAGAVCVHRQPRLHPAAGLAELGVEEPPARGGHADLAGVAAPARGGQGAGDGLSCTSCHHAFWGQRGAGIGDVGGDGERAAPVGGAGQRDGRDRASLAGIVGCGWPGQEGRLVSDSARRASSSSTMAVGW